MGCVFKYFTTHFTNLAFEFMKYGVGLLREKCHAKSQRRKGELDEKIVQCIILALLCSHFG